MTTSAPTFVQQYSDFVRNTVLTSLSATLKSEKNVDWSPDEMAAVLSLPPKNNSVNLPSYLTGGNAAPAASGGASATSGRTSKKANENYTGPRCEYVFTRGKKEGLGCELPCVAGSRFCKHCITKKSAGGAGTKTAKGKGKNKADAAEEEGGEALDVSQLEGYDNLFKEQKYGFVIEQVVEINKEGKEEEKLYVVGIENGGNIRRTLTEGERENVKSLKLELKPELEAAKPEPAPAPAKVEKTPVVAQPNLAKPGLNLNLPKSVTARS
jgi:hypothetical protein